MKYLLLVLLVGCGEVHGMPFGDTLPGSGGSAGGSTPIVAGTGGAVAVAAGTGGVTISGTGGAVGGAGGGIGGGAMAGGSAGAGGQSNPRVIYVESLPLCPDYVTEFGSPIAASRLCGVSADNHLLYGCVGVERSGYPLDTTPCQFVDQNDQYNDSHVFGCVDVHTCS